MIRPLAQLTALAAAGALLSGCISLFPKSEPGQLYRFGLPEQQTATASVQRTGVSLTSLEFDRAAEGDAILTTTAGQAAYIAGARWVAPASGLFADAVEDAFAAAPVRLMQRGEIGTAPFSLRLEVTRFEAQYASEGAVPAAVVALNASLVRNADRRLVAERRISARVSASENRVSAIVPAFDAALAQSLPELASWTAGAVQADLAANPIR